MAISVGVHPPKTPVTKGSRGVAKNTIPNVCKMPGPPAPFVPSPLPNIGKSGLSPKGYSKTVKIEGQTVAIRGATFKSMGDMASKGTGGGLISANTHGPTKFITPGSMTVKIEGKNVHLLGEPMLNNCGPSGTPPNTGATLQGVDQDESDESTCPPHDFEFSDLTEEAEEKRREELEEDRKKFADQAAEQERLADYHQTTGRPKAAWRGQTNVSANRLLERAIEDDGYAKDKKFEQDVAEDTNAVWTGIKFECKKCGLNGEIDVFTPDGIIKECKRPGTVRRDQVEKFHAAGPAIFGAAFKGVHQAIPGDKVRTLRRSADTQGLKPGKDFGIQPH